MRKFGLFILLFVFFTSCDPGGGEKYYIENLSDHQVMVYYKTWEMESDSTITITPGDKVKIFEDGFLGNAYDREDMILEPFDSISIYVNEGLELTKDYTIRDNWEFKIDGGEKRSDGGTSIYTFIVENDDFEIANKK